MPPMFSGLAQYPEIGLEQLNFSEARIGSASQQVSQLSNGGLLSPCITYLLLCDTMVWGLATQFCTCVFSKYL
jgi:hypothetical protein